MLRALIVDDEPLARDELAGLLTATGRISVVGRCGNAVEALHALRAERPDVLFLDVEMPGVSGFELLGMLDEDLHPQVVFVTAHDEFAVKAFEENAVDYLLKPVDEGRLAKPRPRSRASPASPRAPSSSSRSPRWSSCGPPRRASTW